MIHIKDQIDVPLFDAEVQVAQQDIQRARNIIYDAPFAEAISAKPDGTITFKVVGKDNLESLTQQLETLNQRRIHHTANAKFASDAWHLVP